MTRSQAPDSLLSWLRDHRRPVYELRISEPVHARAVDARVAVFGRRVIGDLEQAHQMLMQHRVRRVGVRPRRVVTQLHRDELVTTADVALADDLAAMSLIDALRLEYDAQTRIAVKPPRTEPSRMESRP